MIEDIELQDLPTVATNDIPEDSLIPIAFRESNLTPFELYKITLRQLQIKLTTIKIEDIYNSFEKDPALTNILFELENDLIILNYDETTLNNLINDVQNFIIPQLNEIILALTNQTTSSLYNLFQEFTTIYNILDYLNQQSLNSLKTVILSVPERININKPYSDNNNYSATNNDYSFYLDGFYNIIYLNIFIDTQINLDREIPINIFKMQDAFDLLTLSPENNITEIKVQIRLKFPLKDNLSHVIVQRPITIYKSTETDLNSVLHRVANNNLSNAEGNSFSFSLFFNKDGFIANDLNDSSEILAMNDIALINRFALEKLEYVLSPNLTFTNDGSFFSTKFVPLAANIDIAIQTIDRNIIHRLFMLDLDCTNISDANIEFSITIGNSLFDSITINNPKKRALFLISTIYEAFALSSTGLVILDGIDSSNTREISIIDQNVINEDKIENLIIYQKPTFFLDERTINLQINGDSLKKVEILLDLEDINSYYKAYSFTINALPTKTLALVWIGNPNTAGVQITKLRISFDIDQNFLSTEILNSEELTTSMITFLQNEMRLLSNQIFGLNLYYPLGILSNRSSLNDPFGSAEYTASNISLQIPERENEYRFRGGLYVKSLDTPNSPKIVITQTIHLNDWDIQNGIKIEKNPDEKAFYIFVDNLNKKYYCDLSLQLSRNYNSNLDIVFLLDAPTAIINDPTPNFATTYGYQIAGHTEIFRKTISNATPNFTTMQFVLDVVGGVATETPYSEPIFEQFDSSQYWTIPEIEAYVAQEIAIIISGGTIDLSGYATVQNLNDAVALLVPLNQYNIDQNIVDGRLTDLENRVTVIENDITTINAEILDINNDITTLQTDFTTFETNINTEIDNINSKVENLQNQINNIDGVSIDYVNQINFNNQVQITPWSTWYQIDTTGIPLTAILIEKDIPLSAIKNRYLGLLDDAIPDDQEYYIHLKINIVKDNVEWNKQYEFQMKSENPSPFQPDITTRISNPMPIDNTGNYCVPTYVNFGSFAKRVEPNDISFFSTSEYVSNATPSQYDIFQNLNHRNTALFDTNEIINRVIPPYTPKHFIEQEVGYIEASNNIVSLMGETLLCSTNNLNEKSFSIFSLNHSKKIPINLVFALKKRRIIYFEINNPYSATTNVIFSMYHEDQKTLSIIQSKNYNYQLFALFTDANAVPLTEPAIVTSTPIFKTTDNFLPYGVQNAFASVKNLDMTIYNNPIEQIEYSGDAGALNNSAFVSYAKNPFQSYDTQFIYDGRLSANFLLAFNEIFLKGSLFFNSNFTSIFGLMTAIQRDFFVVYAQNCISDPSFSITTQQVNSSTPYEHLWQIVEYNLQAKYIVQNTNILLATDNYDGTINDVEQTQLYFSAYKNEGAIGVTQPYNSANENKVFVINCLENTNVNFTLGAIPYISNNFYTTTLVPNNMKLGFHIFNIDNQITVQSKFILEGSIDLLTFFAAMFLYENTTIQNNIINTINIFIAANPIRPYVSVKINSIAANPTQRFHQKNLTDSSQGVLSYNITFGGGEMLNLMVMNSLPPATNIDNT